MTNYVNAPIPVNPQELEDGAYDLIRTAFSDWEPSEGNLDVWLIKAFANMSAQIGETATDVSDTIFRYFGSEIANLPPQDATSASGVSTWTMIDDAGYTIPAGTELGVDNGETLIVFQTASETVIDPGDTSAADVTIVAVEPGAAGNDLSGDADLIDPLDYVDTVTLPSATGGGEDEESDEDYLDRLVAELQLLAPRPILPADFATLAKRISGVGRATAINGYNPGDDTYDNERTVTVAVVDEDGDTVPSPVKAEVDDYLTELREVNFIVHVIDPDFMTIDVSFTAVAFTGWEPSEVETNAEAALAEFLSPANWGRPTSETDPSEWENEDTVRYLEVAAALNDVEGLNYVETLSIEGGTADVVMTGPAPLPQPGTISGTVTAPT